MGDAVAIYVDDEGQKWHVCAFWQPRPLSRRAEHPGSGTEMATTSKTVSAVTADQMTFARYQIPLLVIVHVFTQVSDPANELVSWLEAIGADTIRKELGS